MYGFRVQPDASWKIIYGIMQRMYGCLEDINLFLK